MSLLRKIKRNFRLINNSRDSRNKHKDRVKRQSRVVLDALEPRVLLSSDLQALLMPADYLSPNWGEDAEFGLEISNTGSDLTTGGAAVDFYMDVNGNGTLEVGTDLELTSVVANTTNEPDTPSLPLDFSADNLLSGEHVFGQYTITMPASGYSDGDYTIMVSIDGTQVSDPDSSNNFSSFTIPIGSTSPTGGIDLNISDVIVPALESMDEMAFGGVYSASAFIHNVGDTSTSGAVNVSFYLSSDMYLTPDAVLMTTDGTNPATVASSGVISGGGSELVTSDIKMPASNPFGSDSEMYIVAVVDADGITSGVATGGTETEVYESNNGMPAEEELTLTNSSSVTGIDLGAGELYFGTLDSGLVPNLTWGQTTGIPDANVQYFNGGDSTSTGFDVEVIISPTADPADVNAVSLTSSTGAAITADTLAFGVETISPTAVPATFGDSSSPTGWAYAFAKIDSGSTNTDVDSANNISDPVRVWMGSFDGTNPDLSPYDVEYNVWEGEKGLLWGDQIDICSMIANVGVSTSGVNSGAPMSVTFYLHDDDDISNTATFTPVSLGSSTIETDLASGEMVEVSLDHVVLTRPTTLSTATDPQYRIVAVVDGGTAVTTEASVAPNSFASIIEEGIYDVEPVVRLSTNAPAADWTIPPTVHIELASYGGQDITSNSIDVKFYLSSDTTLDTGSDQLVGTYTFNFNGTDSILSHNLPSLSADYALDFSGLSSPVDGDYTIFAELSSPSGVSFDASGEGAVDSINMPIGDMSNVTGMDINGIEAVLPAETEPVWGASLDLALVVGNIGDTNITGSFDIEAYLSYDKDLDASDISVGSAISVSSGIVAGSETVVAYTVSLPTKSVVETAFGSETVANTSSYQIIFKLDSADAITETYNYNNYLVTDFIAIADSATATPTGIDVAGQHLFSSQLSLMQAPILQWGGTVDVYSNFENIGPTDETSGFTINYYLSPTDSLPTDVSSDTTIIELVSADSVASLASGALSNAGFSVKTLTIPAMPTNATGSYYLIARASGVTSDSDLSNNDIVLRKVDGSAMAIDLSLPDIVPDSEDGPEYDLYWKFGNEYLFALDLFNNGQVEVGSSVTANIYLSAVEPDTSSLTVSDLEADSTTYYKLTSDYAATFATGEFESINDVVLTLPSGTGWDDGTYYLIFAADTDEAVDEQYEDNNITFTPVNIVNVSPLAGKTDISLIDFEVEIEDTTGNNYPIMKLDWNSTYTDVVEFMLYNAGDAIASGSPASFTVEYRLTTDGDFDGSSDVLGSATVTPPVASLSLTDGSGSLATPVSGTDGLYYIVARADSASDIVAEDTADRFNNDSKPIPVYIGNWASSAVDLVPINTDISLATGQMLDSYKPGDLINVNFDMLNVGDTQAQPFTVEFYLSDDGVADTGELITPDSLSPASPGALDGQGGLMQMSATLTIPTPTTTSVTGEYQLIVKVVPNGADTGEISTNNTLSTPIAIDMPDLAIGASAELLSDPTIVDYIWGQSGLEIELEFSNEGPIAAASFDARVVLSADATYDAGTDIELGVVNVSSLAAGASYHTFIDLTIPEQTSGVGDIPTALDDSNPGTNTYYVIAVVDSGNSGNSYAGVLDEIDETNNEAVQAVTITDAAGVTLQTGVADLVVVDGLAYDDGSVAWGSMLPVELKIYNDGDTDAGAFDIQFALSADTVWDGSGTDIIIDQYYMDGSSYSSWNVASLASATLELIEGYVRIPDYDVSYTESGYKLIAKIDSDLNADDSAGTGLGDVDETGFEDNNVYEIDASLSVGQPLASVVDIVPASIVPAWDLEADITPGGTINVVAGVFNAGDTDADPASATIDARFFLVSTTTNSLYDASGNISSGAIELTAATDFAVSVNGAAILPGGVGYQQAMALTIPDTAAPGSYYLAMLVDSAEAVTETDNTTVKGEMNNVLILSEPDYAISLGDPIYDLEVASSTDIMFTDGAGNTVTGSPVFSSAIGNIGMYVTVTNNGVTAADGYKLKVALYSDSAMTQMVSGTEVVINGSQVLGGSTAAMSVSGLAIPSDLAAGFYYYGITLDSDNALDESGVTGGESNNTIAVQVEVESSAPEYDITIGSVTDVLIIDSAGGVLPAANQVLMTDMTSFNLSMSISNQGTSPADVYKVSAALYTDAALTSVLAGSEVTVPGNVINGGAISQLDISGVPMPAGIAEGEYYIGIILDVDNELDETLVTGGEDNNTIALPVTIEAPKPDISLTYFKVADMMSNLEAAPGDVLPVHIELNNMEMVSVDSAFTVAVELLDSNGTAVSGARWEQVVSSLAGSSAANSPSEMVSVDFDIVLPVDLDTSAVYTLVAKADSGNVIEESVEDNNSSQAIAVTLTEPEIDLVLQPLYVETPYEGKFFWGSEFYFSFQLNEFGNSASPQCKAAVYLASTADSTDGALLLGEYDIPELLPGSFYPVDMYLTLPDNADGSYTDGDYYLVVKVDSDDQVEEMMGGQTAEDNNVRSALLQIGSPNVDIVMDGHMGTEVFEVIRSVPFDMNLGAYNSSLGRVDSPFTIRAVASVDSIAGNEDDYVLGEIVVDYLDPYASYEEHIMFNWPEESVLADGTYRIIMTADVDNVVAETNPDGTPAEDNNQSVFYVELTTLDLVDGIDVIAGDFDMDGLKNFSWGESYPVHIGLMNNGMDDAGAFDVEMILSKDGVYDPASDDISLGSFSLSEGLASGMVYMGEMNITLPANAEQALSDGPYFMIMVADTGGVIADVDLTNNTESKVISMGNLPNGTDFVVGAVELETEANYGDSFTFNVPVSNNGAIEAWSQLSVYASTSPITMSDLGSAWMIGSYNLSDSGELGAGQMVDVEVKIDMPYGPEDSTAQQETYNILIVVDAQNDVQELVENNNSFYHSFVLTQELMPDLEAWPVIGGDSGGNYMPGVGNAYSWGDELTLDAYLNNWGNGSVTDSFKVTYYLSATSPWDDAFDTTALYQLTSKTVSGIGAGENIEVSGAVVLLPETAPERFANISNLYIVSMVDSGSVIEESNEDNNYSDMPIFIGDVPADLGGYLEIRPEAGGMYPGMNYTWGETVPIAMNLQNFGGGDAENFEISYYLAQDWSFQNNDGTIDTSKLVAISSQNISLVEAGVGTWDPVTGIQNESAKFEFDLELPAARPDSFTGASFGYNIVAVIDSGDVVTEYDEVWNNITSNYINIEESSSDLVSFYIDPLNPETGEFKPDAIWSDQTIARQIKVYGEIANFGNSDADDVTVGFYLANSSGELSTAYELGRETVSSLSSDPAIGNHAQVEYIFDIPTPEEVGFVTAGQETGAYTIVMVVDPDNAISETMEDNNISIHPLRLTKQTGKISVVDSIENPTDRKMDFGKLLPGDVSEAYITVFNNGDGPLNVDSIAIDNAVFAIGQVDLPLVVEPGMNMMIPVVLNTTGQEAGLQQGNLVVQSDDPRRPDGVTVALAVEIAESPIDLQATNLVATVLESQAVEDDFADAYWGDTVNVALSVDNISDTDTANGVFVDIYLTDSSSGDGQLFMLSENYSLADLTAGTGNNVSVDLALPAESPFGYSGQLYLVADVHGDAVEDYETDYSNNQTMTALSITSKPEGKPEIAFSYVEMAEELAPGEDAVIDFSLYNSGKADAGSFDIGVYLSSDNRIGSGDILLGSVSMQGLSVESEQAKSFSFTLPEDTAEGLKHIILSADMDNVLVEDNKADNISNIRFNVEKGPEVDLSVSAMEITGDVIIGQEFELGLSVDNTGTAPADGVAVDLFLKSATSTQTGNGTFVGSFVIDTIAPASSFDAGYQVYLPYGQIQSGKEYYLTAIVDMSQSIEEIDETNNTAKSQGIVPTIGSIDLSGEFGSVPASATWGDGFEVALSIANSGEIEASAFNVKVVLSDDTEIDENDFYLTSWTSGGLPADGSGTTPLWAYLPDYMNMSDGEYYILAKVDSRDNVEETDETNNIVASTAISVAGLPELNGYLSSVPVSANYGQTITISDSVSNYGTSAAGEFEVSYYLSQDYEYTPDVDVKLGSRIITSLAAEAVSEGTKSLELVQPENWPDFGQMYLVMVVDQANAVEEKYESQPGDGQMYLEYSSMPIEILNEGKSDLQAVSVSALASTSFEWTSDPANPSVMTIQYELDNNGTAAAGEFNVSFYLSTNSLITADKDYYLGGVSIDSLEADFSLVDFAEFALPGESYTGNDGEFYVGMIIDKEATVDEIVEDNNTIASDSMVEIGDIIKVDLLANDVYGPSGGIVPGEDFDVYAGVFNAGSEPSGSFAIDFYLTSSGIIDASSVKIDSVTMSPINAGSYSGQNFTISGLTAEQLDGFVGGNAIIAMEVNPAEQGGTRSLEESLYSNNQAYDYAMTAISEPITEDAVAVALTSGANLSDLVWGENLSLNYTITPISDSPVDLQLALKNYATGSQYVLSSWTVSGGDSDISDTIGVTLPDYSPFGYDGDMDVVLIVDYNSKYSETSENNNTLSLPVSIGSGLADLAALDISTDPTAATGDSITVYSGVANYGSEDAYGFEVYYYLTSSNTQIDQSSDIMLTSSYVSSLGDMEYFWDAPLITIPNSVTDGSYYLAMQIDKYDDIDETFEDNNTSYSYMPIQIKSSSVVPDVNEPDNQRSSATSLVITDGRGGVDSATIHSQDDVDYYSFVTPSNANGLAVVSVIPDDYLNVAMTVYNQAGTAIGSVDLEPYMGGEEIFTSFSLSPSKTYYLSVDGVGGSLGEYELEIVLGTGGTAGDSYESNETLATASYIGSEEVIISDVNIHKTSDVDYYMFTVPGDSTGEFYVDAIANPELDLVMRLYNANGLQVAASDVGSAGRDEGIEYTGQAGEVYYVAFSSWAGSTGGYGFGVGFEEQELPDSYESNETMATAYQLASSNSIGIYDANINTGSDVDYYSVVVPNGNTSLKLDVYGDDELDSAISVYSSTGRLLNSADRYQVGSNESLSVGSLTAGQTIYIAVDGIDGTTGYYGLNGLFGNDSVGDFAEPNETRSQAYPLELTSASRTFDKLSIDKAGDTDFFKIVLPADSDGTVSVSGTPNNAAVLNLELRLRNSDGTSIMAADLTSAGEAETLTATGLVPGQTYYISVKGWDTTGNYKLKVDTPRSSAAMAPEADPTVEPGFVSPLAAMTSVVPPMAATSNGTVLIEQIGTVNDDILSFGTASSGTTINRTLTIRNTSSSAQTYSLAIGGDDAFTVSSSSVTVAAGSSQNVTVGFSPDTTGSVTGTLTVTDGDSAVVGTMPLSGTGTVTASKPDIQLVNSSLAEISSLTFETTEPENYSEKSFRIRNLGSSNLTITSATITGTNADAFSIIGNLTGRSVASGTPLTARLAFEPLTVGNKTANLVLVTNDPDEPTITIPLSATAGTAVLGVSSDELDFDTVMVDGAGNIVGTKAVTLSNSGNTTLNINSFDFENSAFKVTDTNGNTLTSLDIAAGSSVQVNIVFDPTVEGAIFDTLEFDSNDNESPVITLTADAITGVSTDPVQRGHIYFNDTDGDIFKVVFSTSGDMTFSSESSLDDNTLTGSTLAVDVQGALGRGYLRVHDTNRGVGDGLLNFDSISIDGNFRYINIDGVVEDLNIAGSLAKLVAAGVVSADIDGTVGTMLFTDELDSADISAGSIKRFVARDNITDSSLTTTDGDLRAVSLTGENSEIDITSAGRINSVVARGDFSGDISAQDYLGNVKVLGSIEGENWNVESETDSAVARNVYARKGIDIDSLLVEGSLRSMTSGSRRFSNGLTGNVTADSIRNVRVYGDLDAIIRANSDFGRWSVTGDILDGSHIYEVDVDLVE